MQDDNAFVIQPGVKGNVDYLIDLLKQKCVDDARSTKISKRNQLLSTDNTTNASLTTTKFNSSTPSIRSSQSIISKPSTLSINEHRKYISDIVNSWCENNQSKFNLPHFSLVAGRHYSILISNDANGVLKGNIKCWCGKLLSLKLSRDRFQMSNFYRHLRGLGTGNVCKKLQEMLQLSQSTLSSPINGAPTSSPTSSPRPLSSMNSQPTSSPTTNNHQTSSPTTNNDQTSSTANLVLNTSLSIPIPSNSTTSASLSFPFSTHDDENTSTQPSQSAVAKRQVKRKIQTIEPSYTTRASAKRTRNI